MNHLKLTTSACIIAPAFICSACSEQTPAAKYIQSLESIEKKTITLSSQSTVTQTELLELTTEMSKAVTEYAANQKDHQPSQSEVMKMAEVTGRLQKSLIEIQNKVK